MRQAGRSRRRALPGRRWCAPGSAGPRRSGACGGHRSAASSPGRAPDRLGVDAERHRRDDGGVDAHAVLQGAQLLQALALLQDARRQTDEAGERAAAIGVEADVVDQRASPHGIGAD